MNAASLFDGADCLVAKEQVESERLLLLLLLLLLLTVKRAEGMVERCMMHGW